MKITAIRAFPVWVGTRNQLLVKVETDEGIFGWGESGLSGREKAVVGAIEHFAEFAVGRDPMRIGALWQEMYRSQYFEGGRVLTAAISAIDIALHDIKGKALGVPVYDLLGGKQRDRIPTFASTSAGPGPEMIEQAKELVAPRLELRAPVPGRAEEPRNLRAARAHRRDARKWCVKAREALGGDVVLGIDYHHRLSVAEAASFCQKMPRGTLDFLEEPIRDETPEAYEALRTMTDIPFAIGEEFAIEVAVPALHRARHPPVQPHRRLQCRRPHGSDEGRRLERGALRRHDAAQSARARSAPRRRCISRRRSRISPGSNAAPRPPRPISASTTPRYFPVQVKLENAHYTVPTAPGLGIEVDEARLTREAFKFWEAPHLRRRDGSFTNW